MAAFVTLEHDTCLRLILQLGNPLVSESYQFHVSPYFFFQSKSALIFVTLHFGTHRVNDAKSVAMPHHVQGKFHFKPSICIISSFHFPCQSTLI
jgi:hypothetical protein